MDDDEYVWTAAPFRQSNPLHKGLQEFESCMHCQICGSFFQSPVSIQGCFHTFCSECIRGAIRNGKLSMRRTALCPICRAPIEGNENDVLLRNRSIEELVRKFKDVRSHLLSALSSTTERHVGNKGNADKTTTAINPAIPNGSRATTGAQITSIITEEKENSDPELSQTRPFQHRKKIPTTYYNGMKRKKLQEKCREWGLSEQGSDQQLKSRHQEFVNLYNAECDSSYPRSDDELVRLVQDRERAIRDEERKAQKSGAADHSLRLKRIKDACKAAGEDASVIVASGDSDFDRMLSQGFKELCANLKKRKADECLTTEIGRKQKLAVDHDVPNHCAANLNPLEESVAEATFLESQVSADADPPRSEIESTNHPEETIDVFKLVSNSVLTSDHFNTVSESAHDEIQVLPLIPPQKGFRSSHELISDSSADSNSSSVVILPSPTFKDPRTRTEASASRHIVPGMRTGTYPMVNSTESKFEAMLAMDLKRRRESDPNRPSIVGPWNCTRCTFYNKVRIGSRSKCEMCESARAMSREVSSIDKITIN